MKICKIYKVRIKICIKYAQNPHKIRRTRKDIPGYIPDDGGIMTYWFIIVHHSISKDILWHLKYPVQSCVNSYILGCLSTSKFISIQPWISQYNLGYLWTSQYVQKQNIVMTFGFEPMISSTLQGFLYHCTTSASEKMSHNMVLVCPISNCW